MTLEEERLKIRYEHKLHVWRIVIEKALLGLLIGIGALVADMVIENYKSDLSREKFLLESRLTALQALRASCSMLNDRARCLAHKEQGTPGEELLAMYNADLVKFTHLANTWSILFSSRFNEAIRRHVWTHQAIAEGSCKVNPKHWPFFCDVGGNFSHITREALWEKTPRVRSPIQGGPFELEPWSVEEVNEKGINAFFEANLDKWQRWKTTAK